MALRDSIENNPTVWLLSTLVAGFVAGIGAYQSILKIASLTTIPQAKYESLVKADVLVAELQKKVGEAQAREGKPPSHHQFVITSDVTGAHLQPKDKLRAVTLNQQFYLWSAWSGMTPKGYYEEKWEISGPEGIAAEMTYPFVPSTPEQVVYMPFTLNTPQFEAGKYRVRVYLNGERHEDRELVVAAN